jgi:sulfur-oxidizing protein SoxX
MKKATLLAAAFAAGITGAAVSQQAGNPDELIKKAFPSAPADWAPRMEQDETMKVCSATKNNPSKEQAAAIMKRERATIEYPADGKFMGDHKKGERLAQSGYGLRFSDYPPARENGGNCYACHQLTVKEVSYGTVGPSLLQYGKLRDFKPEAAKEAYEKIYNGHAALPCSNMPRFGSNKVLTIDQIKDAVALLMDPESPVNK